MDCGRKNGVYREMNMPEAGGSPGTTTNTFYHLAPAEDIASMMNRGFDPPAFLMKDWMCVELLKEATREIWEEHGKGEQFSERTVLLEIKLPSDWKLGPDEAFPEGVVVSEDRIPAEYMTVVDDDFWEHILENVDREVTTHAR